MTGGGSSTRVVQITNIAPQATKDQMQSLFGTVGKIEEIRLYPTVRDVSCPVQSRICYVKYIENHSIPVAQHLTNTVFIDRALIVIPIAGGQIPDEYRALEMATNGTLVPGLQKQNFKLPSEVVNRIDGFVPNQVIRTDDPKLVEHNLPEYPPLPVNFDARKIEETRRTIVVVDVPANWKLEGLMDIFKEAGEVKYARWAETGDGQRMAMIEFCDQKSVIYALKLQGTDYEGKPVNVYHSTQPITKPEAKSNEAAQKEIEEAMSIVKEAQSMISAAIDPVIGMLGSKKSKTRSRSRSKRRSRSRSHSRSRSRRHKSRSRKRSRDRSRDRRTRSRSHSRRHKESRSRDHRRRSREKSRDYRKRSRSRDRKRRSRSREYRRRSRSRSHKRSRSRDRRRRSYSRDRKKAHRTKEERRRKTRSRSRGSKPRSPSHGRSSHSKHVLSKSREKVMRRISEERPARDYDAEERIGHDEEAERVSLRKSKSPSPQKSDNMDISNSP